MRCSALTAHVLYDCISLIFEVVSYYYGLEVNQKFVTLNERQKITVLHLILAIGLRVPDEMRVGQRYNLTGRS